MRSSSAVRGDITGQGKETCVVIGTFPNTAVGGKTNRCGTAVGGKMLHR